MTSIQNNKNDTVISNISTTMTTNAMLAEGDMTTTTTNECLEQPHQVDVGTTEKQKDVVDGNDNAVVGVVVDDDEESRYESYRRILIDTLPIEMIDRHIVQPLCGKIIPSIPERWWYHRQYQQQQKLQQKLHLLSVWCITDSDGTLQQQQREIQNMLLGTSLISVMLLLIWLMWYCLHNTTTATRVKRGRATAAAGGGGGGGIRRQRSIKQPFQELFDSFGRSLASETSGNFFSTEADGMEILRTTNGGGGGGYQSMTTTTAAGGGLRGRFSTFDFFGMNHTNHHRDRSGSSHSQHNNRLRGRTTSVDSLDAAMGFQQRTTMTARTTIIGNNPHGNNSNHKTTENGIHTVRDRLGSMNVYYARAGGGSGSGTMVTGRGSLDFNDSSNYDVRSRKGTNRTMSDEVSPRDYRGGGGFRVPIEPHLSSPAVIDDGGDGELYLYDEFGIVTLSHRVTYYGPTQISMKYSTWTPPTAWAEASRRIIPTAIMTKLQRRLILNVMNGMVEIKEPTSGGEWDFSLPTDNISIHVQRPLEGGVVSLYVKGTSKEEWMEHTFESAHSAAQFQLDLLAYQFFGKSLLNIFEALNLVHQGSIAYNGQEYVLHDGRRHGQHISNTSNSNHRGGSGGSDESDTNNNRPSTKSVTASQCVAWDDAMRAMSSIPTIRIALERLWLTHRHPSNIAPQFGGGRKHRNNNSNTSSSNRKSTTIDIDTDKGTTTADLGLLTGEYLGKRLLLGPVDFFRLFVPALPETATPEGASNRIRMEQLLSWRKRVARAAVLVRYYTKAHQVTNMGWNLSPPGGDRTSSAGSAITDNKVTKRLAYDGNDDNNVRDTATKNEVYEASVSRDVLCYVRPFDYLSGPEGNNYTDQSIKQLVLSPFQAYSYVGSQYFQLTQELIEEGAPLHPSRDPVDVFPSLKALISRNPDLDFFITAFTNPDTLVFFIHVYVRSLAKGIDPQFDNVIDRFSNGTLESRESKLFVMFQLGNRMGLSYGGWLVLRLLAFLFQLFQTGRDCPISLESTRDRYAFPAVKVSSFFRTYHFGGALQNDKKKPNNYIAMNSFLTSSYMPNRLSKMLFSRIQAHVSDSITDLTYVIEGEHEDELPERALSTIRQVRVDPQAIARDPIPHITFPDADPDAVNMDVVPYSDPIAHGTVFGRVVAGTMETGRAVAGTIESMVAMVSSPLQDRSPHGTGASPLHWPGRNNNANTASDSDHDADDPVGLPKQLYVVNENGDAFDPIERAVADVMDILHAIKVPSRLSSDNLSVVKLESSNKNNTFPTKRTEAVGRLSIMSLLPVLDIMDRYDIERYIRTCDFNLHMASLRIVQTAVWRGSTFPIDARKCRIELQNGQFFQQGLDRENNPIYYFRNMCLGPWRMDEDAVISSILYRFDKSLREFCKSDPYTKITLIVLLGIPKPPKTIHDKSKKRKGVVSTSNEGDVSVADDNDNGVGGDALGAADNNKDAAADAGSHGDSSAMGLGGDDDDDDVTANDRADNWTAYDGNPRISPNENWKCHSSDHLMERMFGILAEHYPSRLAKVLVVKGRGNKTSFFPDSASRKLKKVLAKQLMQDKIRFENKTSELVKVVEMKQLVTIVGGAACIDDSAYDI